MEYLTKEELIEKMTQQIEDAEYDLKNARSPKKKRLSTALIKYFKSIKHHLQ